MASVASARTAMIASLAPMANAAIASALDDRVRVALHERTGRCRRRVGAIAVGHHVAPGAAVVAAGPPLVAGREAGTAAAAQAGCRDRRRSCPSGRDRGPPRAGPRTRRRAIAASRSVGSSAPAPSRRIVGQPAGVLRTDAKRHVPRRRRSAAAASAVRRALPRYTSPPPGGGRPPPPPDRSPSGGLEAEVRVVGGGAVDHRVPGAGELADPLERGDRAGSRRRPGSSSRIASRCDGSRS